MENYFAESSVTRSANHDGGEWRSFYREESESCPRARMRTWCLGVDNIYVANFCGVPERFPFCYSSRGGRGKNDIKTRVVNNLIPVETF